MEKNVQKMYKKKARRKIEQNIVYSKFGIRFSASWENRKSENFQHKFKDTLNDKWSMRIKRNDDVQTFDWRNETQNTHTRTHDVMIHRIEPHII